MKKQTTEFVALHHHHQWRKRREGMKMVNNRGENRLCWKKKRCYNAFRYHNVCTSKYTHHTVCMMSTCRFCSPLCSTKWDYFIGGTWERGYRFCDCECGTACVLTTVFFPRVTPTLRTDSMRVLLSVTVELWSLILPVQSCLLIEPWLL